MLIVSMFDWVQSLSDWLIYSMIGIEQGSALGDALNFFVFDTIKITILLFLITFVMGIVNAYFPIERIRSFLSRNKLYGGEYLLASTFGAATPFCSCSSMPLFIGFVRGGIPLGVTFAFLVTSPLVNEVAVAILIGFRAKNYSDPCRNRHKAWRCQWHRNGSAQAEHLLTDWVYKLWKEAEADREAFVAEPKTFVQRLPEIAREALGIVKSVTPYILIGIAVGAAMHGYVPEGFFEA